MPHWIAQASLLLLLVQGSFQICNLRTGLPSCILWDPGFPEVSTSIEPQFWTGVGNTNPGGATVVYVDIQAPGNIASFDVALNCGGVFLTVGQGPILTFSTADITNLQSYYSQGGVIVIITDIALGVPNGASIINPLVAAIDPSVPVIYGEFSIFNGCEFDATTSTGLTSDLLTTPNDITLSFPYGFGNSFIYPTPADPECFAYTTPAECTLAQSGGFIFFTDTVPFISLCGGSPQSLGENVGAVMESCAGIGGDPHTTLFDDSKVEFPFGDGKYYVLYGNPDFRIVIKTSGWRLYITSIGITLMPDHQLLATLTDHIPSFYLNGELIEDFLPTPVGIAQLFIPDVDQLSGSLAEQRRYVSVGLRIGNLIEIVGGISPSGGFFNLEVERTHKSEFGILHAAMGTQKRDADLLAEFEVESLF